MFGGMDDGLSGIEVSNSESTLSPVEEQAVILHSNAETSAAIAVLQADLPNLKGQRRLESWLMLFELFQQANNRPAFEALGLDYVIEFEKTPPIWRTPSQPTLRGAVGGNVCALSSRLVAETVNREMERLQLALGKGEPVRLDLGKVREIDSIAAVEFLAAWQSSKRLSTPLAVLGAASFVKMLSEKIQTGRNVPAEAPFWLLLMEVHQAAGQLQEFEDLAVEYAITYEVSPPSWDVRLAPKEPDAADKSVPEAHNSAAEGGLSLHGAIVSQNAQALVEIRDYLAHGNGEAVLDFLDVERVDFETAGQLLNLFMTCLQQGKLVRLVQVNELVFGLLRIMGVTELVTVERRKS